MPVLRFQADATFHIGQTHINHISPCQDFADAFASKDNTQAFLVVSDGCSTGGQTDIGSRFVARRLLAQAKHLFASGKPVSNLAPQEITEKDLEFLALSPEDVYATALYCWTNQDGACAYVYGDGLVAFGFTDGSIRLEHLEWQQNVPYYPVYSSKLGKKLGLERSFLRVHGNTASPFTKTSVLIRAGEEPDVTFTDYTTEQGMSGVKFCFSREELQSLCFIALFSDGVDQIGERTEEQNPLEWISVAQESLAFRNTTGDFAKRRIRRALQSWKTAGFYPQDDLACSVMLIRSEVEPEEEGRGKDNDNQ